MNALIGKMVSLGLGIVISPEIIVIGLWVAGQKEEARKKAWLFCLGGVIGLLMSIVIGFISGSAATPGPSWTRFSLAAFVGTAMFILGLLAIFRKHKGLGRNGIFTRGISRRLAFLLGLVISALNIKVVSLAMTAGHQVSLFNGPDDAKMLALAIFLAISLLPMSVPAILETAKPGFVSTIMVPCNRFLERYGHYVAVVICFIIGVLFWRQALSVMP